MRIEKKLDLLMERQNINQSFKPYSQSVQTQKAQREQRQMNSIKRKEKTRNNGGGQSGSEMLPGKPPMA